MNNPVKTNARVVASIEEIAAKQQASLTKTYQDYEFIGAPIRIIPRDDFSIYEPDLHFTPAEMTQLKASAQVFVESRDNLFMIDMSKISTVLLQKFLIKVPLYNPYTDLMMVYPGYIGVLYYKKTTTTVPDTRRVIPFTNENGDSVFQYACTKVRL